MVYQARCHARPARWLLSGDDANTALFTLRESEGYKPADFDRLIEIAGDGREFETIDESTLFEAQPDFVQWLPRE